MSVDITRVGLLGVRWGVCDFLQIALQSPYVPVVVFPPCLIQFFD